MNKQFNLRKRSELAHFIREFFESRDFVEVHTPIIIDAPAPEEYIESITASNGGFLRCSPELAMKGLLCDGWERIYQLGGCFRAGEHGRKHREEFMMLEFYQTGINYRQQLAFCAEMFEYCARKITGGTKLNYGGKLIDLNSRHLEIITVSEAFLKYVGCTVASAEANDCFDELMVTKIEPELGKNGLTALLDYPANRASLARLSPENPAVAERFELYIAGIELANAFGELIDPIQQKARFQAAAAFRKSQHMLEYPEAASFLAALHRMPESSGCAIGFDRLAMIFCDASDIADVVIDND